MGLDGVEMIMAVEEEFGVEISDADAEKMRTPRDLIDGLVAKLAKVQAGVCRSQQAFYKLRRVLCAQTGQPRKTVTPATPLADLLPVDMRDPAWQKLREAVQAEKWPEPVRSPGLVRGLFNLVCLGSILLSFVLIPGPWTHLQKQSFLTSLTDDLGFMGARVAILVVACVSLEKMAQSWK